jgi:hypothetical protein
MSRNDATRSGSRGWTVGFLITVAWIVVFVSGCTTTRATDDTRTVLVGRVYDENGVPLANVDIRSGRFRSITDNRGRFRMEAIPFGTRRLTAATAGHEEQTVEVELASPFVVAHFTLWSMTGLVDQAILYLSRDAAGEARRVYLRAKAIDPSDMRVIVLGEILGAER